MNHTLQHERWTLQGEWTWDAIAALDYAASVPQVDMERVAVCGLSTGGHLAMNVLALDDRVKGGVVAGVRRVAQKQLNPTRPWDSSR